MGLKEEAKRQEEKFFLEREKKLLDEMRKKREAKIKALEESEGKKQREELKKLHWMCCPKCGHAMKTQVLQDLEIDMCTSCEGIFLDRGELETIYLRRDKEPEKNRNFVQRLLGLGG